MGLAWKVYFQVRNVKHIYIWVRNTQHGAQRVLGEVVMTSGNVGQCRDHDSGCLLSSLLAWESSSVKGTLDLMVTWVLGQFNLGRA